MWIQSIGLPTYCLVVTAIENVTSNITVALQWSLNTIESVFTRLIWKTKMRKKFLIHYILTWILALQGLTKVIRIQLVIFPLVDGKVKKL